MNRTFIFLAVLATLSLTACSTTQSSSSYLSAEAGSTYTGTISALNLENIVLSTTDGEIQIPYTSETVFSGFEGSGGMNGRNPGSRQEPGGGQTPPSEEAEAEADSAGGENSTSSGIDDSIAQSPDERVTPDGGQTQTNSAPEDSGNFDSEADDNAVSDGDAIQGIENVPQTSSSIEDVSLNDEVTVQIGDDGTAEAITLSSSAGSGITVVPGDRPVDSITES